MRQSQVSGNGSTNVQVGHFSTSTVNYVTIYAGQTQQALGGSSHPSGDTHQIANETSQEVIRLLTGEFYNVTFFCLTAKVIHIGHPYSVKNANNEIIGQMSNVFFTDGAGVRFSITISDDVIPCAPNTDVSVVFASDASGRLLACGIYDDASGNNAYVKLGAHSLNRVDVILLLASALLFPLLLIACIHFRLWSLIAWVFGYAFVAALFWHANFDLYRTRTQQLIGQKHDAFLARLARAAAGDLP